MADPCAGGRYIASKPTTAPLCVGVTPSLPGELRRTIKGGDMNGRLIYWYLIVWAFYYRNTAWLRNLRAKFRSKMRTPQQIANARTQGLVLDSQSRKQVVRKLQCNHLKGGVCVRSNGKLSLPTIGTASHYSVVKHQHINGDFWIRCLRCGKTWMPPIRSEFKTEREFYRAVEEYETAKNFPTNNVTSTSVLCQFRLNGSLDAGNAYVRKQLANS
jgi:hypothetical protein